MLFKDPLKNVKHLKGNKLRIKLNKTPRVDRKEDQVFSHSPTSRKTDNRRMGSNRKVNPFRAPDKPIMIEDIPDVDERGSPLSEAELLLALDSDSDGPHQVAMQHLDDMITNTKKISKYLRLHDKRF